MTLEKQEILKQVEALYPDAVAQISHALDYASKAHGDQLRQSGEPYIIHPIEVAIILTDLHMDVPTIIAGLLHDTVEDTAITLADINLEFGPAVAKLVDGVSKLQHAKAKSRLAKSGYTEAQA
ncbi:MAG: HD domain-containing protein, partial [Anaerolineae bacterium]